MAFEESPISASAPAIDRRVLGGNGGLWPAYLELYERGELEGRAKQALALLNPCRVCPRDCDVDRIADEIGACRTGRRARIASFFPHFGEEDVLRGVHGSGTIFFSFCNLKCVFCQNHEISLQGEGAEVEAEDLAHVMLTLQTRGCHNINLVSPSHVVPQILEALVIAARHGLRLPLVYNTGGYDSLAALRLLDGVVDIYMPDIKWADEQHGRRYSRVVGYPEFAQAAIREMHRQVGDLQIDESGLAWRGLMMRHLVMPGRLAGTPECMHFLASLSRDTYVNVMDQYRPAAHAYRIPELNRRPTSEELLQARQAALKAGLWRGFEA